MLKGKVGKRKKGRPLSWKKAEIITLMRVKRASKLYLDIMFTVELQKKTHPFRAIVSEINTWQGKLSMWLQKVPKRLNVGDPYQIANLVEVIEYMRRMEAVQKVTCFSIGVVDMYYDIPFAMIKQRVEG